MYKRILVVEDNESILFNISLVLKLNNYDVITAVNGKKALEMLSNNRNLPDLIISDILMPEMNGYVLLENIKRNENWKIIPFIFLSAKATAEEIDFGKSLGILEYVTKPINEEIFLELINKRLNPN